MSDYIAGSCNIGPAEINRRKRVAYLGSILFVLYSIWLVASDASWSMRLTAFFPAMVAVVGYVQARRKFCVAYGFMGVFSFEKAGDTRKITVNQDLLADRAFARKLVLQATAIAALLTVLVLSL